MSDRILQVVWLIASEAAERCVGRLLTDAAAIYLCRRDRPEIRRWLRRQGLA